MSASRDLLRAGRLRLHPLVDRFDPWRQRLHLLDDLRQLPADLLDFLHAAADFLRELVHAHHAGSDGRLDFLDDLVDVIGGHRRLVGEAADFRRHDRKAAPVFARLLGFDGRVEGQQVGLIGDPRDRRHHLVDVARLFAEDGQLGVDGGGGIDDLLHGGFHVRQADLAAAGQAGGLFGHRRHFVHGSDQLLRRRGDLLRRRADLRRGRGNFIGGAQLLLVAGPRHGDGGHQFGDRVVDGANEQVSARHGEDQADHQARQDGSLGTDHGRFDMLRCRHSRRRCSVPLRPRSRASSSA